MEHRQPTTPGTGWEKAYRKEFLSRLFGDMLLIRRFEERAADLRSTGYVPGFLHPYIGQEAVAVGACAALGPEDYITSTHRGHGHILARGADPGRMYAELFARREGYNKAKGGSLHIANIDELGIIGANGIVGGGLPIATGAGLALLRMRQRGENGGSGVAVAFFGDGASNQGAFHESINLAALWKLPVIFVCENNLYGEFTPQHRHQPIKDIAARAGSYAAPGLIADGNDVLDVYRVMGRAVEEARKGHGPSLVECKTYRHRGHYEGDMAGYRPREEVEHWLALDPIASYRRRLEATDLFGAEELDVIAQEVEDRLDAAVAYAKAGRQPEPSEALDDVFVESYGGRALL